MYLQQLPVQNPRTNVVPARPDPRDYPAAQLAPAMGSHGQRHLSAQVGGVSDALMAVGVMRELFGW